MKTPITLVIFSLLVLIFTSEVSSQNKVDCINGYVLCSNNPLTISAFNSNAESILVESQCIPTKTLKNEITFFWSMKEDGLIEFDLLPANPNDDLDFILYKIKPENITCEFWDVKRCMAAGPNLVEHSLWDACVGLTGLVNWAQGDLKNFGCLINENNYLRSLESEAGEIFALKVMNFTSFEGFTLQFHANLSFNPASSLPFESIALQEVDLQKLFSEGCVEKTGIMLTDIDGSDTNPKLTIYPNPSKQEVIIRTGTLTLKSVTIYNAEGKKISVVDLDDEMQSSIDISILHTGLYFFEIVDANGTTYTRSIIKN